MIITNVWLGRNYFSIIDPEISVPVDNTLWSGSGLICLGVSLQSYHLEDLPKNLIVFFFFFIINNMNFYHIYFMSCKQNTVYSLFQPIRSTLVSGRQHSLMLWKWVWVEVWANWKYTVVRDENKAYIFSHHILHTFFNVPTCQRCYESHKSKYTGFWRGCCSITKKKKQIINWSISAQESV